MLSMKMLPQEMPNLSLHLLIEKQVADIKYGQITYTCVIRNGTVDMGTLDVVIAKRRRYKVDKPPT